MGIAYPSYMQGHNREDGVRDRGMGVGAGSLDVLVGGRINSLAHTL